MSHEYAMSRVRDALENSEGNHLKAQRLLLTWLEKDHTLLLGLVSPHLQGIISHALGHASAAPKKASAKTMNIKESEVGEFGAALMSSLRGGRSEGVSFGDPQPKGLAKPGKASSRHVDAINTLASAGKDKGKKK